MTAGFFVVDNPQNKSQIFIHYKEVSKIYKKFLDLFLICHIIKMLNY